MNKENSSPPHIVDSGASVMDKPVAWTDGKGNYFDKNSFFPVDDLTPLYTHPAKTLTDEEIKTIVLKNFPLTDTDNQDLLDAYIFIVKCCIKDAFKKAREK